MKGFEKALLLEYLAAIRIRNALRRSFADDGSRFELPFLRSASGFGPRYTGRREIAAFLHKVHQLIRLRVRGRTTSTSSSRRRKKRSRVRGARAPAATGRTVHTLFLGTCGRGW